MRIFNKYKKEIKTNFKEIYIAPMYQYLIDEGKYIAGNILDTKNIIALGTPEDVEVFKGNK